MAGLIEVEALVLERGGRRVLDGASFVLAPGERVCVEGPNGAGKSTLLLALAGFVPARAGRIVAFGRELRGEADFVAVRPQLGLLFQDPDDQLFCADVLADVAFGPRNLGLDEAAVQARAHDALAELGLSALAGRSVDALSEGEKRLVALAGLVAMRPRALLLDEPSEGLDARGRERLLAALARLDAALLVATHDDALPGQLGAGRWRLADGRLQVE